MSLESTLQSALLLAAPASLPKLRLFRRNITKVKIRGYTMKFGLPGQADLYGYVRGGMAVEVELKKYGETLEPKQICWQEWCHEWNIPHIVLTGGKDETVNETVVRWVEELRQLIEQKRNGPG